MYDAEVEAPPALTTSPEYVYLFRVAEIPEQVDPSANIPTVLLPAAEPKKLGAVADVALVTTHVAYVYLERAGLRKPQTHPLAKIPKAEVPVADPWAPLPLFVAVVTTSPA